MYVTTEMDISAGSVPAGPNLNGRMNPGPDEQKRYDEIYQKQIHSYFH